MKITHVKEALKLTVAGIIIGCAAIVGIKGYNYTKQSLEIFVKYVKNIDYRVTMLDKKINNLNAEIINTQKITPEIVDRKLEQYKYDNIIAEKQLINYIRSTSVVVGGLYGIGSGTVIKKTDSYILVLTCYHVIDDVVEAQKYNKDLGASIGYINRGDRFKFDGVEWVGAEIIKTNKKQDMAILKAYVYDERFQVAKLTKTCPEIGDVVYSSGCPLTIYGTVSKGIISNIVNDYFVTDTTITFGNSGGGLFNRKGELIGMPAMVYGYGTSKEGNFIPESGLGWSINICLLEDFAEEYLGEENEV